MLGIYTVLYALNASCFDNIVDDIILSHSFVYATSVLRDTNK